MKTACQFVRLQASFRIQPAYDTPWRWMAPETLENKYNIANHE